MEDDKFKAAVAVVKDGSKWLLGLAKSSGDRDHTWCFPGGRIRQGEEITRAACRECFEETGIRCEAIGEPFTDGKKGVAFVKCRKTSGYLKPNSEFVSVGFFTVDQMKGLKLYKNVERLINKVD